MGFEGHTAHTSLRSMAVLVGRTKLIKAGAGEEIGAGAASPLTVVLPTKPRKTAMPGGVLGLIFASYVPLASQSPYRPHLSHFRTNM